MDEDLLNILSNSNKDIDNQKLMDYVSNKISDEERYEIEKEMLDSQFINDAVEGLNALNNVEHIKELTNAINEDVRIKLKSKKKKRSPLLLQPTLIMYAIILIIILAIIGYVIIRKHLGV